MKSGEWDGWRTSIGVQRVTHTIQTHPLQLRHKVLFTQFVFFFFIVFFVEIKGPIVIIVIVIIIAIVVIICVTGWKEGRKEGWMRGMCMYGDDRLNSYPHSHPH